MTTAQSGEFSVWLRFPDGGAHREASSLEAEPAVLLAREISLRPAAQLGTIAAILITDRGDHTVFLWEHGRGVVFPHLQPEGPSRQ